MVNSWIEHVKAYAQQHKVSYREALSLSKDSYIKGGGGSKSAGFVKRLIAEKAKHFDIDRVNQPSKWIIERYSKPKQNEYDKLFLELQPKEIYERLRVFLQRLGKKDTIHYRKINHDSIRALMNKYKITAKTILENKGVTADKSNDEVQAFDNASVDDILNRIEYILQKFHNKRFEMPANYVPTKPKLLRIMNQYKITKERLMRVNIPN